VANAIHAATGVGLRDLPTAPPKILAEEPSRLAAEKPSGNGRSIRPEDGTGVKRTATCRQFRGR
jgi:hypothetical protein